MARIATTMPNAPRADFHALARRPPVRAATCGATAEGLGAGVFDDPARRIPPAG
jgi:hypothetical protein